METEIQRKPRNDKLKDAVKNYTVNNSLTVNTVTILYCRSTQCQVEKVHRGLGKGWVGQSPELDKAILYEPPTTPSP